MNRVLSLLFVVAMVGWLVAAPVGAATADSEVTLTVSVVDQGDVAIGGADVEATWDGGSTSATTASNGRALIDVPEGADVSLDVEHEDFVRNHPLEVDDASEREATVRMSLKGHSTVTVTDADGDPVEGATVTLERDGRTAAEGQTGADGTYESGVVEQGRYDVGAVKPGYYRESTRQRVGVNGRTSFELERGDARLDITVVDDHFEETRTLEGARVRISDAEGELATLRATSGTASMRVPVNNRYRVTVLKDGYREDGRHVNVIEGDRTATVASQRVPSLTVESQNGQVIVGETTRLNVVNAYGEPVEGAEIRHGGETVGETDADGYATVTVDGVGEQAYHAALDGVESDPIEIEGVDPDADEGEANEIDPDTQGDLPGFGVTVAVLALLSVALLGRRS